MKHRVLANLAVVAGTIVSATAFWVASPAVSFAASSCYGSAKYGGYNTTTSSTNGIEGDVNYSQGDMELSNNQTDHGDIDLTSYSQTDSQVSGGHAWEQIGWNVGASDGQHHNTTEVYAESYDLNDSPNPHLNLYPSLGYGNRWFDVYYTGEKGSDGRGLYYGSYGQGGNYTFLGSAWLIDPYASSQIAQIEGYAGSSSSNCPKFSKALFGTTGSANNYDSTTVLRLWTDLNSTKNWTSANFAAASDDSGPYSTTTYNKYDAFNSTGGSG